MDDLRAQCIRTIDDHLRKNPTADVAIMTPGIAALGQEATDRIIKTITVFDDFCHANDPGDEHDTGSFEAEGRTVVFKIDHYERPASSSSLESRCLNDRVRIITVMLAEES
jgi:Protein of unknown function (DUF3768)